MTSDSTTTQNTGAQPTAPAKYTLRFLGTGASCGVPTNYCGCKACEEALQNPELQRSCSGLLISGTQNTLIDASPDLRMQLSLARTRDIHQVLFTHEHFDHIGGIPQLEYYVRLISHEPLAVYAGAHTLAAIAEQFAFMSDTLALKPLEPGESVAFDGVRYTPLPATHGTETFGYLIERVQRLDEDAPGKRIAYFPDTGPLQPAVHKHLEGVDVLIIDATFNGNNWMPASHHSIDEAIALAQQLGAKQTYLTHLSLHFDEPITTRELQAYLTPYEGTVLLPQDGLEITL